MYTTLERKLKGTLSLKRKKLIRRVVDLKITLILQKGRFLLIVFCNRVLIAREKLPRYGRAINNYFFSTVNVKVVMKLSTSLMGNAFFLKMSFKWLTSVSNLEKSETFENVLNNKVKPEQFHIGRKRNY